MAPTAARPAMAMEPEMVEAAPVNWAGAAGETGVVALPAAEAEPVETGETLLAAEAWTGLFCEGTALEVAAEPEMAEDWAGAD